MRRSSMIVVSVALVMALGFAVLAAPDGNRPKGPQNDGGRPGVGNKEGQGRPDRPQGPGPMVHRAMMIAVSAPWALSDAEAQKLVDKVLADRKQVNRSEAQANETFEALVKAARAEDQEAVAKAREASKNAMEKLEQDRRTMFDDMRALAERVKAIAPEDARERLEGDGPGGDRPRGPRGEGEGRGEKRAEKRGEKRGGQGANAPHTPQNE